MIIARTSKFMALALLLLAAEIPAQASLKDCRNPFELNLGLHVDMKFCEIPAAEGVRIGNNARGSTDVARPVKPRNFKKFHLGQTVVTQAQYKAVMNQEPWLGRSVNGNIRYGADYPAVQVSYPNAVKFTELLSKLDPTATYRMPTEAELEYATRAGTTTEYWWGDFFDENPYYERNVYVYYNPDYSGMSSPGHPQIANSCPFVGIDCTNGFGLFHMVGNVEQWASDCYEHGYKRASQEGDVPVDGPADCSRVTRGRSWMSQGVLMASYIRGYEDFPRYGSSWLGFRVVRVAK